MLPGLVWDGREESQDPPPEGLPTVASIKIDVDTSSSFRADLVRADDVTRSPYDPMKIKQAAFMSLPERCRLRVS